VIIVNWNGKHLLGECLDSLLAQSFRDYEIIVVDNGSQDGSVEYVRRHYPDVRIVSLPANQGTREATTQGYDQLRESTLHF